MIRLYCRDRHGSRESLCATCADLASFARFRLEKCPFKADKPTCANCAVHCYRGKPEQREQMRRVMRYAGPRMIFHHPILALRHALDNRRKAQLPARQRGKESGRTERISAVRFAPSDPGAQEGREDAVLTVLVRARRS